MPTRARHAIPSGYEGAIPYLFIDGEGGAAAALAFYVHAFGAEVVDRVDGPGGRLMHAELRIGRALFMLADASPEQGCPGPTRLGGSPVSFMVYVPDVDAFHARAAAAAGLEVVRPLDDRFYGDRNVTYRDPFRHTWTFGTHREDLTPDEIRARAAVAG